MDPATIQQIAAEVARHLPSYAWMQLLVAMLLMAIAGAVGAFFGEYLKTRGKNLATKADLESIKAQLSATTQVVEAIKSEVGQKDWATRERTTLRRIKLEALLEKMNDCNNYLDQHRNRFLEGKGMDPDQRDYLNELNAMGSLYFPELENEVGRFYLSGRTQLNLGLQLAQALNHAGNDLAAIDSAHDSFRRQWSEHYEEHFAARRALTVAARRLLVSIMGEED